MLSKETPNPTCFNNHREHHYLEEASLQSTLFNLTDNIEKRKRALDMQKNILSNESDTST